MIKVLIVTLAFVLPEVGCKKVNDESDDKAVQTKTHFLGPLLTWTNRVGKVHRLTALKTQKSDAYCIYYFEGDASQVTSENGWDNSSYWIKNGRPFPRQFALKKSALDRVARTAKKPCDQMEGNKRQAEQSQCSRSSDGAPCKINQSWAVCDHSQTSAGCLTYSGSVCVQENKIDNYDCEYDEKKDPAASACAEMNFVGAKLILRELNQAGASAPKTEGVDAETFQSAKSFLKNISGTDAEDVSINCDSTIP
jgi:hypothetical protein